MKDLLTTVSLPIPCVDATVQHVASKWRVCLGD